jgi:hypothetical protein
MNKKEAQQKIFFELKKICQFPVGHTLEYVHPSSFGHDPNCKRCKLLKLADAIGVGNVIRTPDDH